MTPLARRVATTLLRSPVVNRAVRVLARARGHRLVLVYHRVGPPAPTGCEIVPSVPVDVFRMQLQALGEIYDLVTLDEVLREDRPHEAALRKRAAVAVTFAVLRATQRGALRQPFTSTVALPPLTRGARLALPGHEYSSARFAGPALTQRDRGIFSVRTRVAWSRSLLVPAPRSPPHRLR